MGSRLPGPEKILTACRDKEKNEQSGEEEERKRD